MISVTAKALLHVSTHLYSVCTQCPLHTQTHMHTPKCRNVHFLPLRELLHTHTNTRIRTHTRARWVVESPWHWLPPISAASLLVQVAATMTTMQWKCNLWTYATYAVPAAHALIDLLFAIKILNAVKKKGAFRAWNSAQPQTNSVWQAASSYMHFASFSDVYSIILL